MNDHFDQLVTLSSTTHQYQVRKRYRYLFLWCRDISISASRDVRLGEACTRPTSHRARPHENRNSVKDNAPCHLSLQLSNLLVLAPILDAGHRYTEGKSKMVVNTPAPRPTTRVIMGYHSPHANITQPTKRAKYLDLLALPLLWNRVTGQILIA